jgi:TRAP-type C4-dicarboxylate transport system permease small subunit
MNRTRRVVLVVYCLLILYCCIWVPSNAFEVVNPNGTSASRSLGYDWLWKAETPEVPAIRLVALRIVAVSALAGAVFVAAGKWQ